MTSLFWLNSDNNLKCYLVTWLPRSKIVWKGNIWDARYALYFETNPAILLAEISQGGRVETWNQPSDAIFEELPPKVRHRTIIQIRSWICKKAHPTTI